MIVNNKSINVYTVLFTENEEKWLKWEGMPWLSDMTVRMHADIYNDIVKHAKS